MSSLTGFLNKILPRYRGEQLLEKALFNHRPAFLILFVVTTFFLLYQASLLRLDPAFEKMLPQKHSYIINMLRHGEFFGSMGNGVTVAVEATDGNIFTKEYMETLEKIHDEIFYIEGVDRTKLLSLWSPAVQWSDVTADGLELGPVIPVTYNGSAESLELLKMNVLRSGRVGSLVADNFKSTTVEVSLLAFFPGTDLSPDPQDITNALETKVREKYGSDKIKIHITGLTQMMGVLINGISIIVLFFAVALIITFCLLYIYSRCIRSSILPLACSIVAVIWQLGLLHTFGYGLNLYSILVPFLIFAIGVSHGVQIINAIAIEKDHGDCRLTAARLAFRALYMAGLTALLSDAIGFLTLFMIEVQAIKELGIASALGVGAIIVTNLCLLPVVMSYVGVSKKGVDHMQIKDSTGKGIVHAISLLTTKKYAVASVTVAGIIALFGIIIGQGLQFGDLDQGEPMLKPNSVYNQDIRFINENYTVSSDTFVVMVEMEEEACSEYSNMEPIDRFEWEMADVPGVQSTMSIATISKIVTSSLNEGNLKWSNLSRDQQGLNYTFRGIPPELLNRDCSLTIVVLFLEDHKAETLDIVTAAVADFAKKNNTGTLKFVMASGSAGIEAATNQVIRYAQGQMMMLVYGVVSLLVFVTFRSLRAVACIIIPLSLTSILCQALMAELGIGIKVVTLPVIALGVGVGVDYGIYIYSRLETYLKAGMPLREAYEMALRTTGKAVAFTGGTLAVGVATWIFAPIKFQADMGVLLVFMFLWNMVGALWLLPALAYFFIKPSRFNNEPNAEGLSK